MLGDQLDHVAAADLEVAGIVDARARAGKPAGSRSDRRSALLRWALMERVILTGCEDHRRWNTPRPARPTATGVHNGLAYTLWLPDTMGAEDTRGQRRAPSRSRPGRALWSSTAPGRARRTTPTSHVWPRPRAGPRSPSTRAATARARVTWRPGAFEDVVLMADLLAARAGSTRGGSRCAGRAWAASSRSTPRRAAPELAGVIAICPAGEDHLTPGASPRRARDAGRRPRRDRGSGSRSTTSATRSSASRAGPLILMHAEGDDQIPSMVSEELLRSRRASRGSCVLVPGGDHRSVQHDAELQASGPALARKRL